VRTDVSTVEVRGFAVLLRLFELGVVRVGHQVANSPAGPFVVLRGRPDRDALLNPHETQPLAQANERDLDEPEAPAPAPRRALSPPTLQRAKDSPDDEPSWNGGGRERASTLDPARAPTTILRAGSGRVIEAPASSQAPRERREREISVVVTVRGGEPEREREVSNVILLSAADLEVVDDDDDEPVGRAHSQPEARASKRDASEGRRGKLMIEEEVILLSADDIEEFEAINAAEPIPPIDSPWQEFRRAMNLAAARLATQGTRQEATWDLFRSMMVPRRDGAPGPSEESWRRFQARLSKVKSAPVRPETTWDRFRQLMATPVQVPANTWERFVQSIGERRLAYSAPIKGEAVIKSGVNRVVESDRPSVEVHGLGDD